MKKLRLRKGTQGHTTSWQKSEVSSPGWFPCKAGEFMNINAGLVSDLSLYLSHPETKLMGEGKVG